MQVYFKHARMHIRSAMEYRASFYMQMLMQVVLPLTSLLGFYLLFERFGSVSGWTFSQVTLIFSTTYMAFSLAEVFGRGFDRFAGLIRKGTLDRLLVQPRSLLLLVFCADFGFHRISKLAMAIVLMILSAAASGIEWTLYKIICLILMPLGGALTFLGIFVASATLCIWTVESAELTNVLTDGGKELSSFPLDIYVKPVTVFFTFAIPFGMCNYVPLLSLLGRAPAVWGLSPLYAAAFFAACVAIFYLGVKHYRSAG